MSLFTIKEYTNVGPDDFDTTNIRFVDVLMVAGGGGSGRGGSSNVIRNGGGGGAGGLIYIEGYDITKYGPSISLSVGAGGSGADSNIVNGSNGENTTFGDLTAVGGGGGASANTRNGSDGGSGGGAGRFGSSYGTGGSSTQTSSNDGYDNSGFGNIGADTSATIAGGGGGGAGSASLGVLGGGGKIYNNIYGTGGDADGGGIDGLINTGNGGNAPSFNSADDGSSGGSGIIYLKCYLYISLDIPFISRLQINSVKVSSNVYPYTGDLLITERGFVYGTSPNPTTADTKIEVGDGAGSFTTIIENLQQNTKYYIRAYAISDGGLAYSDEQIFYTKVLQWRTWSNGDRRMPVWLNFQYDTMVESLEKGFVLKGRNTIRQLIDRTAVLSADGGEFTEAYTAGSGRRLTVISGTTTALFNTDRYFISGAGSILAHNISANEISSGATSLIGIPLYAGSGWYSGANIQYKLLNPSGATDWLDSNKLQFFSALDYAPTQLHLNLISNGSLGVPAIRGFSLYEVK
jgi:hypothetical protein